MMPLIPPLRLQRALDEVSTKNLKFPGPPDPIYPSGPGPGPGPLGPGHISYGSLAAANLQQRRLRSAATRPTYSRPSTYSLSRPRQRLSGASGVCSRAATLEYFRNPIYFLPGRIYVSEPRARACQCFILLKTTVVSENRNLFLPSRKSYRSLPATSCRIARARVSELI